MSDNITYNPSNIFALARLVIMHHMTEYSLAKTLEYHWILYWVIFKTICAMKSI